MSHTITLHRVLRAPPAKVYRAFTEPLAMCRWLPPYGFLAEMLEQDLRVGGRHRMAFINFGTGHRHSFGGEYLELVPHERLRYTDRFDDPGLPGEMVVTVTLRPVLCGTELQVTQEHVPAVIPPEMCFLGWQESLEQLARLVEPDIPSEG